MVYSDIIIGKDAASDKIINDFESELNLLQTFVEYGYTLNIKRKSTDGHNIWENRKSYKDTQEWFKDLLKQRRKEKLNND